MRLINRNLSFMLLLTLLILNVNAATIWTTDEFGNPKLDYAPTEVVYINGEGFLSGTIVRITIDWPDGLEYQGTDITDSNGRFLFPYDLAGLGLDGTYHVTVTDDVNSGYTIFTDASNSLQQCANGKNSTPSNPCTWQTGSLNTNNAHYVEGQSVGYRLILPNMPMTGEFNCSLTSTDYCEVELEYDIKHSGANAFDYLTSFQRIAETVNPCSGISPCNTAPDTTSDDIPIPSGTPQPQNSFNSLPANEKRFQIYNGQIISVTYNENGSLNASQAATSVRIRFRANSTTVVLAWGAHIASYIDWGLGNSAGGISGAPYHMRFSELCVPDAAGPDCKGGNQDRSMQSSAIAPLPPYCGDGILNQDSEECDDWNNIDGDGCSSNCIDEYYCPEETLVIERDDIWDAWVYEYSYQDWNQFNYGGHGSWQVGTRTTNDDAKGRAFFRADLAGVPTNSKIMDADFQVYFAGKSPDTGACKFPMSVNRIASGVWTEGNQSPGGIAVYPEISWQNQQYVNISSEEKIAFDANAVGFMNINMTEFVKNWNSGNWENLGFVMKRDEEGTSKQCVFTGIATEYIDNATWNPRKPKITVRYVPLSCGGACGDGNLDEGEECDDGNQDNTDSCLNTCIAAACGDTFVHAGIEECDDGANEDDSDTCYDDCTFTYCGDDLVQSPNGYGADEYCDGDSDECRTPDGYHGTRACLSNCSSYGQCAPFESCGDGEVNGPEECDDGNSDNTDSCLDTCIEAICGDGLVLSGEEECDDGNHDNFDGCRNDCTLPYCGDNIIDEGETCEKDSDCGKCQVCNSCACEYPVPAVSESGNSGPTGTGGDIFVGVGIGAGISTENFCPEIVQEHCGNGADLSVCYQVDTSTDLEKLCNGQACIDDLSEFLLSRGIIGRSYAFEGETIHFNLSVLDKDGIIDDCVHAYVTLDNGYDPVEAGCTLVDVEPYVDLHTCAYYSSAIGNYECTYTVEPTEGGTYGEYWISVQATDGCGEGCSDNAAGVVSLYLNPEVSLTVSSQDAFGLRYDMGGKVLSKIEAGKTVYSPSFRVENSADPKSGLYMLLQLYGTDMWDYSDSSAMCPTTNVLDISNVEYRASHLNVHQDWTTMPEGFANKVFAFNDGNFGGNFIGVGDDITMKLRLNVPSPCKGNFMDGGEIVFVGHVI